MHLHWRRVNNLRQRMSLAPLVYGYAIERHPRLRDEILTMWVARHKRTVRRLNAWQQQPIVPEPYYSALMCIHSGEGSMVSYNPAGPYYGGWQMNWGFMETWGSDMLAKYGGRDARYWRAGDQLLVAYRAARAIGYGPWPQTAAKCGLL